MSREHELDLLLINPGGRKSVYQDLATELTAIEPPVWAGLMATYVRRKGYSVDIIDANALELGPAEVAQQVCDRNPALTAVVVYGHQPSASTQVMPICGAICSAIKAVNASTPLMLVGGHVASLPDQTLHEEEVDFVCTGEGPVTLAALLSALKSGVDDFSLVPGLAYREGDGVRRTIPAALVNDLDKEMPGVAWDLLPMDRYRAHNWECFGGLDRQPYAAIYTTLGCPYTCSFCCIQAPFKEGEMEAGVRADVNTYRRWSVESVMAQIDSLVNDYGIRNFKFADEMFVLHPKHVEGICDGIIERGYDLNIWAYARVDTIRPGMTAKLKRAGFNWLALGIEAADAHVRDDVQKGYSQDDIVSAIERCRADGIYVLGNYIFGLPEDSHATMQKTLDLALELNCEFANFYCAMAYPGSQLYAQALREGLEPPGQWSRYSQHSIDTQPLATKYLRPAEVLEFRDRAFTTYFTNARYLRMVGETFGEATVGQIERMTARTLDRSCA